MKEIHEGMADAFRRAVDELGKSDGDAMEYALNAAVVAAGYVLVPCEPTRAMIEAGQTEHDNCVDEGFDSNADGERIPYTTISPDAPAKVYRAMLNARPSKAQGGDGK